MLRYLPFVATGRSTVHLPEWSSMVATSASKRDEVECPL